MDVAPLLFLREGREAFFFAFLTDADPNSAFYFSRPDKLRRLLLSLFFQTPPYYYCTRPRSNTHARPGSVLRCLPPNPHKGSIFKQVSGSKLQPLSGDCFSYGALFFHFSE